MDEALQGQGVYIRMYVYVRLDPYVDAWASSHQHDFLEINPLFDFTTVLRKLFAAN